MFKLNKGEMSDFEKKTKRMWLNVFIVFFLMKILCEYEEIWNKKENWFIEIIKLSNKIKDSNKHIYGKIIKWTNTLFIFTIVYYLIIFFHEEYC